MNYYLVNTWYAFPEILEFNDIDKLMYQLGDYDVDFSIYSNVEDYKEGQQLIKNRIEKRIVIDTFSKSRLELSGYEIIFNYRGLCVCTNVTRDRDMQLLKLVTT